MSKKTLNFEGFSAVSDQIDTRPAQIVLASASRYRKAQLAQLDLEFSCDTADIDESRLPGELPEAMALRLSKAKAEAVAGNQHEPALIIGSDQTASCKGQVLGKPGNAERAVEQLLLCSGSTVIFHSGLCVLDTVSHKFATQCTRTKVRFRQISEQQVRTYIKKEQPLDCAGSFKCEGLGICLFESISSDDPSALVGLPLIALCNLLSHFNYSIL